MMLGLPVDDVKSINNENSTENARLPNDDWPNGDSSSSNH